MVQAKWIAVDWGTSNLRAWAVGPEDEILDQAESPDGMGKLNKDAFEPALLRLVEPWLGDGVTQVVCCGMVGARQGWREAPYRAVPCDAKTNAPVPAPAQDPRLSVHLIPGLQQDKPADVMRGEETQIAGYLAQNPNFEGILCLPGTHSKWVHVSAEEIVSFRTFMTGEMFDLLAGSSVLKHSIGDDGWDDAAFADAMNDTISRPENLAARLFSLRAQDLLHGQNPATARATLSGYLIGAELAAARPFWLGQSVVMIGASALSSIYGQALAAQGVRPDQADGTAMTLAGLIAAHSAMKVSV